ncbi:unnamed protein product [Caenorhabditis bovis]|uniref:Transmembrane protein adipocyte-associated 1 homolog n=1 Tax=Caenorhabditis bovis TaxID=2654633 RepID=A0A8S1ESU5_9PELO|nr:unnamed protein product [Caenorhabditis bovis]
MSVIFQQNPGTSLGATSSSSNLTDFDESVSLVDILLPNVSSMLIDAETHRLISGMCRDVFFLRNETIRIRYWDLAILIPNLIFLIFLLAKCRVMCSRTLIRNDPVFRSFFILAYISSIMNIVRSFYSMTISVTNPPEHTIDQSLWFAIKFVYLTAELCVLSFALLFGHFDNIKNLGIAIFVTLMISVPHTAVQMLLEMRLVPTDSIYNAYFDVDADLTTIFWIFSSMFVSMIYLIYMFVALVFCRKFTKLPSRPSFVVFCVFMISLNILQALGAVLLLLKSFDGFCFVAFSTYAYFFSYSPILYFAFLRKKLNIPPNNSSGMFMYRKHEDEFGELPESYFPRFSGLISSSYDDLFDYSRDRRFGQYSTADYLVTNTPLISSAGTVESTVTAKTCHDESEQLFDTLSTARHLKGLGPQGSLVFADTLK